MKDSGDKDRLLTQNKCLVKSPNRLTSRRQDFIRRIKSNGTSSLLVCRVTEVPFVFVAPQRMYNLEGKRVFHRICG